MIPVEQIRPDDCFSACVASILELPIDAVGYFPHAGSPAEWTNNWVHWLDERGFDLYGGIIKADRSYPDPLPRGYWILSAASPRTDVNHAVVCLDDKIVWDPHPQREMGVGEWRSWYKIERYPR